jgi:hypothetical protein
LGSPFFKGILKFTAAGGEGPLASLTDAKAQLTVMDAKDTRLEFLIGCTYDSSRDRLSLAAGAPGGDVAIFPLKVMGDACRLKPARFSLRGGHSSVSGGLPSPKFAPTFEKIDAGSL